MIAELGIIVTALLFTLPRPTALSAVALSLLSPVVGCETVCMEWVSPFLSSAIVGFALSIASFVFNLNLFEVLLIDVAVSGAYALALSAASFKGKLEEVSEAAVVLSVLASVGLAYCCPEATSQAMLALTGSLWTVDPSTAWAFFALASAIALLSLLFQDQLSAAMFDPEYLVVLGRNARFWSWLLFFFLVLGTSFSSYSVGLFASQVVLILPAALSLKAGLRRVETGFEATYLVSSSSLLLGCWVSNLWGLPEVGVAGMTLILLIVSLNLSKRIAKARLMQNGSGHGRDIKGYEQQKAASQALGKG